MVGLIATKEGMTRIFHESGESIPVSVLKVDSNFVSQIKNSENDGYSAIQLSSLDKKEKNTSKSYKGHFTKNNLSIKNKVLEFRITEEKLAEIEIGKEFSVDIFEEGQFVDISGVSKGKGFAGTVKRWNFATQDATHGNSLAHRKPVWKGKKMSGHMGNVNKTIQNLKIVKIDGENKLILVKGSIPGPSGSTILIKPAIKK